MRERRDEHLGIATVFGALFFVGGAVLAIGGIGAWSRDSRLLGEGQRTEAVVVALDRIRDTQLSETLLGQFTPASGDPRLIARYAKMSAEARSSFSFTPALTDEGRRNRAITVWSGRR